MFVRENIKAMKIYILTPNKNTLFTPELIDKLNQAGEVVFQEKVIAYEEVEGLFSGDEERVLAIDPDFCNWEIPNEVIEKIPNLKAICLQTTSFSWIDLEFCRSKNIYVTNLRGFSTEAVAEWAITMALNLARKVPVIIRDGWKADYLKHQGIELRGKRAGVIGLGSIGTRIAELCRGLGMEVVYWSKSSRDKRFEFVELGEVMKSCDVVFPAVAQNKETNALITDEMLLSMKDSAIFVSIIHNVYNHDLVVKMMNENRLYGYGFEEDREVVFNSYSGNIWAGPALGWCSGESLRKNGEMWVESIIDATNGKFINRVAI